MKHRFVTKNKIYIILIAMICLTFTACGGGSSTAASSDSGGGGENSSGGTFESEYHDAEFHEDSAEGAGEVQVDLSCVSDGYFGVVAKSDSRLKLQVIKDDET